MISTTGPTCPSNGPLFTLTGKFDTGHVCDTINITGAFDLAGLTIVPSDGLSKTPAKSQYLIATATGGFTGTPVVDGFTDGKKWLVVRRDGGNQLWLTSKGGTILILK